MHAPALTITHILNAGLSYGPGGELDLEAMPGGEGVATNTGLSSQLHMWAGFSSCALLANGTNQEVVPLQGDVQVNEIHGGVGEVIKEGDGAAWVPPCS